MDDAMHKCSSQRCITGISSMATGARRSAAIFDGPSSRKPALARLAARLPWPANPAGLSRWCETCSIGWVTLCTRKESCPGGQGGFSGTGRPGMAWHGSPASWHWSAVCGLCKRSRSFEDTTYHARAVADIHTNLTKLLRGSGSGSTRWVRCERMHVTVAIFLTFI